MCCKIETLILNEYGLYSLHALDSLSPECDECEHLQWQSHEEDCRLEDDLECERQRDSQFWLQPHWGEALDHMATEQGGTIVMEDLCQTRLQWHWSLYTGLSLFGYQQNETHFVSTRDLSSMPWVSLKQWNVVEDK